MVSDRVRKSLRLAEYAVTLVLIAVAVFGVAEYLTGTQPFYVVTDNPSSMSPTLNYGGLAVIVKVPFGSVGPGAIIAFHDPRGNPGIIVHRVASTQLCGTMKCLITKGDNNSTNPTTDPWEVTQTDYIGEAVLTLPYVGYISPALWGFSGYSALLPASVVVIAVVLVGVLQYKPEERREARA
ncbi:MAG TPA: signal peptidase I [Nitrososphaerales archaeon]|nr:signal peptidase I [Nitrososphaerales archaeon]